MIILFVVIIFIIIIMLIGYNKQSVDTVSIQQFKVVLVDKAIKEYIGEARKNKDNVDKLYKEIVFDPIWNDFASKGEYSIFTYHNIKNPIKELDMLEKEMEFLVNEGAIQIVENALEKCSKYLSGVDTTTYIFPAYPGDDFTRDNMGGVSGFTLGKGKILVMVNPLSKQWKETLPYVIAHEYHHSIWTIKNYKLHGLNLLEYLVFEGKADSFANIVYPEVGVGWTSALKLDKEKVIWNKIKPNLKKRDRNYNSKVVFGDYNEFPLWSGYTIGFHIFQEYLRNNPNISIKQWTNISAKKILDKSQYEESLKINN